jgi:hypothetical protein
MGMTTVTTMILKVRHHRNITPIPTTTTTKKSTTVKQQTNRYGTIYSDPNLVQLNYEQIANHCHSYRYVMLLCMIQMLHIIKDYTNATQQDQNSSSSNHRDSFIY